MESETDFLETYEYIRHSYEHVMKEVDKAIAYEEEKRFPEAIDDYKTCLMLIDEIFDISLEQPDDMDSYEAECDDDVREMFESLKEVKKDINRRMKSVSKGPIVRAAGSIARNLVWGATKSGELMVRATPHILTGLSRAGVDVPPVPRELQTSMEVAKAVTGVAAWSSGLLAWKVCAATLAIGRFMAPHVKTHGSNLLQRGLGYNNNEGNAKMEKSLNVAADAVESVGTIYTGLQTSAKILGNSLKNNSVKIIAHKYGPSASTLASNTFDTIGNAFNVSQNMKLITPKGLMKGIAHNTAKEMTKNPIKKEKGPQSQQQILKP